MPDEACFDHLRLLHLVSLLTSDGELNLSDKHPFLILQLNLGRRTAACKAQLRSLMARLLHWSCSLAPSLLLGFDQSQFVTNAATPNAVSIIHSCC